jgi:hypothetical protein
MLKNKISWSKSLIFILLLLSIIVGNVYVYIRFFNVGSFNLKTDVPVPIQQAIDTAVARDPIIVGVQIIRVDLKKNVRYILYSSLKDPAVKKLYLGFIADNITVEVPIFTKNAVQDAIMLSIINHEFVCYPFTDTISYELVPALAPYIKTVCSTTIPVQYGNFEGFVAVFLSRVPTETEKDLIRIESKVISGLAYEVIK